jgi:predicted P-loop ATPase
MAARISIPGCKVDTMTVIEGKQGVFKSSAVRVLGGEFYVDASSNIGTKDFLQQIQGKIIVEISELDVIRKSDESTIKRVLSNAVDDFRLPYAKDTVEFPRQSIFVGTTNDSGYLKDPSGNRRFWPVEAGKIALHNLTEDREQLFAEAYERISKGEAWHEMPPKATLEMQKAREIGETWSGFIEEYLNDPAKFARQNGVCIPELLIKACGVEKERMGRQESNRVSNVLQRLGWFRYGKHRLKDYGPVMIWKPGSEAQFSPPQKTPEHNLAELPNYAPGAD